MGGVRKQAERHSGRIERRDAGGIAQQSGSVSSVGVTDRAEILVIAAHERRADAHSLG